MRLGEYTQKEDLQETILDPMEGPGIRSSCRSRSIVWGGVELGLGLINYSWACCDHMNDFQNHIRIMNVLSLERVGRSNREIGGIVFACPSTNINSVDNYYDMTISPALRNRMPCIA